jgi:hypothetical protein
MKKRISRVTSSLAVLAIAWATVTLAIPARPREGPPPKATDAQSSGAPAGGFSGELDQMLNGGQRVREHDPLAAMAGDMSEITDNLDQQQTGAPVQGEQRQVVSQLDKLIEQLNKQCNGNGSGVTNNPSKPMTDSKIAKGPGGIGPMHDPQAGVKSWGELPAKERDKILQSQNDGFPAGYESLLSSYYNRLAQEQVGDEGKSAAAPATQP